jgi:hypothetical protein
MVQFSDNRLAVAQVPFCFLVDGKRNATTVALVEFFKRAGRGFAGGFMFWFQDMARRYTDKPVLMSSLVALPSITAAFAHHEQVFLSRAWDPSSLSPAPACNCSQCTAA